MVGFTLRQLMDLERSGCMCDFVVDVVRANHLLNYELTPAEYNERLLASFPEHPAETSHKTAVSNEDKDLYDCLAELQAYADFDIMNWSPRHILHILKYKNGNNELSGADSLRMLIQNR